MCEDARGGEDDDDDANFGEGDDADVFDVETLTTALKMATGVVSNLCDEVYGELAEGVAKRALRDALAVEARLHARTSTSCEKNSET